MSDAEKQRIISELREFYKKLRSYQNRQNIREKGEFSEAQDRSLNALRLELQRKYGRLSEIISRYGGTRHISSGLGERHEAFDYILNSLNIKPGTFTALDGVIATVNQAIGKLESDITMGIRDKQGNSIQKPSKIIQVPPESILREVSPKAFIAHEGETKALDKLKDFLAALGVKYLIAEKMPSDGRLVEGQVNSTYEQADFVVVLATKGKAINKITKTPYMGLNVADELGRAREAKKRVVLLLQKGVEPHTNIAGIVYEQFTTQSMDRAFTKIANELRSWGFVTVGKVETKNNVQTI